VNILLYLVAEILSFEKNVRWNLENENFLVKFTKNEWIFADNYFDLNKKKMAFKEKFWNTVVLNLYEI